MTRRWLAAFTWLRRDRPDRPLLDQMRDAFPQEDTTRECVHPQTGKPRGYAKSDGRERMENPRLRAAPRIKRVA